MKKGLIIFFMLFLSLCVTSISFAKEGISIGGALGFSFDMGGFESETMAEAETSTDPKDAGSDGGVLGLHAAVFGQYTFNSGFLLRTGFEYSSPIPPTESKYYYNDGTAHYDYEVKVTNWAIPLLAGINISPTDRTNIYLAAGIMFLNTNVTIEGEKKETSAPFTKTSTKEEYKSSGPGKLILLGMNTEVSEGINLLIEAERYFWSDLVDGSGDAKDTVKGISMNYWTVRMGVALSL